MNDITKGLRAWIDCQWKRGDRRYEECMSIADHIDAEHEAMLVDARKTVYQGYIELPKDADGEYIRIGDLLTNKQHNGRFRVEAIGGNTKDGMYVVYFRPDNGSLWFYYANQCHHYHAPQPSRTCCTS